MTVTRAILSSCFLSEQRKSLWKKGEHSPVQKWKDLEGRLMNSVDLIRDYDKIMQRYVTPEYEDDEIS